MMLTDYGCSYSVRPIYQIKYVLLFLAVASLNHSADMWYEYRKMYIVS
jgi:hypothetical protein